MSIENERGDEKNAEWRAPKAGEQLPPPPAEIHVPEEQPLESRKLAAFNELQNVENMYGMRQQSAEHRSTSDLIRAEQGEALDHYLKDRNYTNVAAELRQLPEGIFTMLEQKWQSLLNEYQSYFDRVVAAQEKFSDEEKQSDPDVKEKMAQANELQIALNYGLSALQRELDFFGEAKKMKETLGTSESA